MAAGCASGGYKNKIKSITWRTTPHLCGNLLLLDCVCVRRGVLSVCACVCMCVCVKISKVKCIIFPFGDPFSHFAPVHRHFSHFVSIPKTVAPAVAIYEDLCVARMPAQGGMPRMQDSEYHWLRSSGLSTQESWPTRTPTRFRFDCTCFDLFGIITDACRSYYSLWKLLALDNKNGYLNSTRK